MELMTILVIVYIISAIVNSYQSLMYDQLKNEMIDYISFNHTDFYKEISSHFPGKWHGPGFVLSARIRRGSLSLPKDKFLIEKYKEFYRREKYIEIFSITVVVTMGLQWFLSRFV